MSRHPFSRHHTTILYTEMENLHWLKELRFPCALSNIIRRNPVAFVEIDRMFTSFKPSKVTFSIYHYKFHFWLHANGNITQFRLKLYDNCAKVLPSFIQKFLSIHCLLIYGNKNRFSMMKCLLVKLKCFNRFI